MKLPLVTLGFLFFSAVFSGCTVTGDPLVQEQESVSIDATEIDFQTQVLPLLERECNSCHGQSGGLNLEELPGTLPSGVSGPSIVPCEPDSSLLYTKVCPDCPTESGSKMPPLNPLSEAEVNLIRQWIAEGAQPSFMAGACP